MTCMATALGAASNAGAQTGAAGISSEAACHHRTRTCIPIADRPWTDIQIVAIPEITAILERLTSSTWAQLAAAAGEVIPMTGQCTHIGVAAVVVEVRRAEAIRVSTIVAAVGLRPDMVGMGLGVAAVILVAMSSEIAVATHQAWPPQVQAVCLLATGHRISKRHRTPEAAVAAEGGSILAAARLRRMHGRMAAWERYSSLSRVQQEASPYRRPTTSITTVAIAAPWGGLAGWISSRPLRRGAAAASTALCQRGRSHLATSRSLMQRRLGQQRRSSSGLRHRMAALRTVAMRRVRTGTVWASRRHGVLPTISRIVGVVAIFGTTIPGGIRMNGTTMTCPHTSRCVGTFDLQRGTSKMKRLCIR